MKKFILKQIKRKRSREIQQQHGVERRERHTSYAVRAARDERRQTQRSGFRGLVKAWLLKDGWAAIGIVALVGGALWYYGIGTGQFVITDIDINGVQFISSDEVRHEVSTVVDSRSWSGIKRNTYWTLRPEIVRDRLYDRFGGNHALNDVVVRKGWPNRLRVEVDERIPSISWVTTKGGEQIRYLVDRSGVVTQMVYEDEYQDEAFPTVYDVNRASVEPGWHIISERYLDFALQVHETTEELFGLRVVELHLPEIACQERQYVAEQIFEREILDSASDEFRERKRDIQELFQQGVLSIDESLEELEAVKQEELVRMGEIQDEDGAIKRLEFATVSVDVECDLVKVAQQMNIIVEDASQNTVEIYLDTTVELAIQLENALMILQNPATSIEQLRYIDVRIPDRAYYK